MQLSRNNLEVNFFSRGPGPDSERLRKFSLPPQAAARRAAADLRLHAHDGVYATVRRRGDLPGVEAGQMQALCGERAGAGELRRRNVVARQIQACGMMRLRAELRRRGPCHQWRLLASAVRGGARRRLQACGCRASGGAAECGGEVRLCGVRRGGAAMLQQTCRGRVRRSQECGGGAEVRGDGCKCAATRWLQACGGVRK